MKIFTILLCFFLNIAFAGELTGLGYAIVQEDGNYKILEVGEGEKTYKVRLDDASFRKEIQSLEVSDELKLRAIELGDKFFKSFPDVQRKVENHLLSTWGVSLEDYSADGQRKLLSPFGCDEDPLGLPKNLFRTISFELSPDSLLEFHKSLSSFNKGQDLVVVDLKEVLKQDPAGMLGKTSLAKVIGGFEDNKAKEVLVQLQLQLADSLNANPNDLYIMTKDAAESFKIPYEEGFSSIRVIAGELQNPKLEFNTSKIRLLEGLETGDFGGIQSYIDLDIALPNDYSSKTSRGEVSTMPKLPNIKNITFYRTGGVEVSALLDGGIKQGAEDFFDPDSYYGQTGLKGEVKGLSVSVITQFETERIQAKGLRAEYKVFSANEAVDLSVNWSLTNRSRDDFIPEFNGKDLGAKGGFRFNIRF